MYSVRAMPTFLVLHNGSVVSTVQGANPPALTAAVERGVKLAGTAAGPAFGSGGQRLGGSGVAAAAGRSIRRPIAWDLRKLVDAIVTFFGLYFVSLISVSCIPLFPRLCEVANNVGNSLTPTKPLRTHGSTRTTRRRHAGLPLQRRARSLLLGSRGSRRWQTWGRAD